MNNDIIQGFTMFISGLDIGLQTETVQLPVPKLVKQEYSAGASHMTMDVRMAKFETLTCTVKLNGYSSAIQKILARGPGQLDDITFRAGSQKSANSMQIEAHVVQMRGAIDFESLDQAQRGEKSGLEFMIGSLEYYRYDIGNVKVRELQYWPLIWNVNGVDQLGGLSAALGY